jgi:hypothetical protein
MQQMFMQFAETSQFLPSTIEKAERLGVVLGFIPSGRKGDWDSEDCAVAGKTFAIKDTLKANGARWNGAAKVWMFNSYAALDTALAAVEVA